MSRQKVYISSTFKDLKDFRQNLRDYFTREGKDWLELCEIMEHMFDDGLSKTILDTCSQAVAECNIYIIVVGFNHGSYPPNDTELTYTEHEYERARAGKKEIYRFVLKGSPEDENKWSETYKKFIRKFDGYQKWTFSTVQEFEVGYLRLFNRLVQKKSPSYNYENYAGTINRDFETEEFRVRNDEYAHHPVKYLCYSSAEHDYSHLFNFRISNIELNTNLYRLENQFYASLEAIDRGLKGEALVKNFVSFIASRLFGNKTKGLYSILQLYDFLNDDFSFDYLLVPIKISHAMETTHERLKLINELLKAFSSPQHIEKLKKKQVLFLINLEIHADAIPPEIMYTLFDGLNPVGLDPYLGELKTITEKDVKAWIKEKIDSNSVRAEEYLKTYFKEGFPRPMASVLIEAEQLITHIINQKS